MIFSHARRPRRSAGLPFCAALLLVTCPTLSVRASPIDLESVLADAPFAQTPSSETINERTPVRAFATAAGVYELDTKQKCVRVWPREARTDELRASRLTGLSHPVSMAKLPGSNRIAVLDACPVAPNLGLQPRVLFYSFVETLSGGVLSSVAFTKTGEISAATLANATDVAFFPSGDRVAVSICRHSSSATDGDEGAIQIYDVPTSAAEPVTSASDFFLLVRAKAVYDGAGTNVGAEPYNVPPTSIAIAADGAGIWVGCDSLNAVLRYDADASGSYVETITIRTWEYELNEGPRYDVTETFQAARADFVQGAAGETVPTDDLPGFLPGDIGTAGVTNNLFSSPGAIQPWDSPNGLLLLVADRDNDRVVAFDEAGNERFSFTPIERVSESFARPEGVWVSEDGAELVVADTGNGRVEIFALTAAASAPDESVSIEGIPEFLWESDATPVTNWIVASSVSLTNRTYSVSASSDPAGCVRAEPAEVEIPAGADRVPFVVWADDGVAGGTTVSLTVAGQDFSFAISNAAPTVRSGPLTGTEIDNQSYAYMEEGQANATLSSFRYGILREGEGIHLHAKAFDVAADGLTYEWRVVSTTNTLMNLPGTTITNAVGDPEPEPNPIYRTSPYYYCEIPNPDQPWITRQLVFTPEEAAQLPTDGAGNPVYLEIHTDDTIAAECWTNSWPLSYAETKTELSDSLVSWAPVLFDDEAGAPFRVSDETLTGADVVIPSAEDETLYFVVLTVTDKDGAVWNSLDSSDGVFFCFATAAPAPEPPPDPAVYSAVFTSVTGTNVVFSVSVLSGTPAAGDTVTLVSTDDLLSGAWTPMESFPVDGLSVGSAPLVVEVFPDGSDPARFYRIVAP